MSCFVTIPEPNAYTIEPVIAAIYERLDYTQDEFLFEWTWNSDIHILAAFRHSFGKGCGIGELNFMMEGRKERKSKLPGPASGT